MMISSDDDFSKLFSFPPFFERIHLLNLSKYARIPPSSAGGMNGLPSPLGERVRVRGK